MASLYSLRILQTESASKLLRRIVENNDIKRRFAERIKVSCDEYTKITNDKQLQFHGDGQMTPQCVVDAAHFYPNTYYLTKMDSKKRRLYERFEGEEEEEAETKEPENVLSNGMTKEEDINQNIARFKVDKEELNHFAVPNIGQFIGDKLLCGAHKLIDKACDDGLSKKGAIQIDKMLNVTHEVTTKCSYS